MLLRLFRIFLHCVPTSASVLPKRLNCEYQSTGDYHRRAKRLGQGTIAGILAKRLGWCLLDSGALYRLLAFAARNHGVDLTNEESSPAGGAS